MNIAEPKAHRGQRVLFIPVEFSGWQMARSFPYDIQLAFEEGFQASDVEVFTLPARWGHASSARASWLSRAKTLLAGQKFDQIWVTLVHCQFEDDFLDWLRALAPVRVGFIIESLEYTPEECQAHPPYKYRRSHVERQMRSMTHVLTWDEYDAARINAAGKVKALWWPGCVPARVIAAPTGAGETLPAVFSGALYGDRAEWLEREDLRNLLVRAPGPEAATTLPQQFDRLQEENLKLLLSDAAAGLPELAAYLASLRQLRREIFDLWMASLARACAQINLPSLVKAYGIRVVEAMAAGCPAISWDIPNRPRNRNLFREGEEILVFRRDQPEELAAQIRRLQNEPQWARQLATKAHQKIVFHHTFEKRIEQVMDWIATSAQPDYGESTAAAAPFLVTPAPEPNFDELARWIKISALIARVSGYQRVRSLDVGCGRGWLTNLAARFGECDGVESEPVAIAEARDLFPGRKFILGNVETVVNAPDFQPYDFVIVSEMLEFLPPEQQPAFVQSLARLLKPGGHVIVVTPRAESLQEWTRLWGHVGHPGVDWLAETGIRQLFAHEKFNAVGQERVLFDTAKRQFLRGDEGKTDDGVLAIYQVWAFQYASIPALAIAPEKIIADYHRACDNAAARALQSLPDNSFLLTKRALALLELGEAEEARQILVWLTALEANHAPARKLLARALRQLGRAAEAEAQLARATQLEAICPTPLVSVVIPGIDTKSISFLQHAHEAKLPDGSPVQLDTRTASINGRSAPCVYLHPATKLRFAVPCAEPGRLTCSIAIQPELWNKPAAIGCEFSIQSQGREVFRAQVNPRRLPTDRRWHDVAVDLPAASGPFHELIFRTRAIGSHPEFRWAVWCDPVFCPQSLSTAQLS